MLFYYSVVFSVGVGEDISFDLEIQNKYNCNIILIDPTIRAYEHYNEINKYYISNKKWDFLGDTQKDYKHIIDKLDPELSKKKYEIL
jgi:hypothetical protein